MIAVFITEMVILFKHVIIIIIIIIIIISGSPNECWVHTCDACVITTWSPGDQDCGLLLSPAITIERIHSRGQHLIIYKNKRKFLHKKRVQFPQGCLGYLVHQHGRRFIALEHHYGRRDIM